MAHFVRPNFVYAGNVKYIKAGNYIETACDAVGIADRTYERWNKEGLKIEAKCFNNEDEKIESEWQKITEMEKAKAEATL